MNIGRVHNKTIIITIFILVLFWLYNYSGSSAFFAIGCLVLFGWFLLGNADSVFLSILVLVPNIMIIKHLSNSAALLGYAMLVFEWKYILTYFIQRRKLDVGSEVLYFIISTLFTFAVTFSSSYLLSAIRVISFACFIFYFFLEKKRRTKSYFNEIILCYCLGVSLTVILGVLFWVAKGNNIFAGYFFGIRNDRNYFSATLSTGIAISALIYTSSDYKDNTRWLPLLMIIMIAGGILSGSRTFLVSLLVSVMIVMRESLSIRNLKRIVPLLLFLLIVAIIALKNENIVNHVIRTLERFSSSDVYDGNGRFDTWVIYLKDFSGSIVSIFFGKGSETAIKSKMDVFLATHNTIVQGLYCGGVVGLLTYFHIYLRMFLRFSQHKRLKIIELFPIANLILCRCFIASFMSDTVSVECLVAIVAAVYRITEDDNDENCTNQHYLWSR